MGGIQHLLETVADGLDLMAQPAIFMLDLSSQLRDGGAMLVGRDAPILRVLVGPFQVAEPGAFDDRQTGFPQGIEQLGALVVLADRVELGPADDQRYSHRELRNQVVPFVEDTGAAMPRRWTGSALENTAAPVQDNLPGQPRRRCTGSLRD